jgi:glycosyltransferase involved in cell wall biosynthesis
MKICVIGTRGFPLIQGGIETHCEELYSRIGESFNCEIVVFRRTSYVKDHLRKFKNIKFVDIRVPKNKYLETFLHSFFSTVYSIFIRPEVVHFHNTGPGVFMPILRLFRIKTILTYHNISYTQKKWNKSSKYFLNFTEWICFKYSNSVIFISDTIRNLMVEKYGVKNYTLIKNGVKKASKSDSVKYVDSLGLTPHKYIIGVGRFLEEKGFDYLIEAYKKTNLTEYKLVLVGDTDYPTSYSNKLKLLAAESNVLLTGFIKGENLREIFSHAKLYIMSSFEEGLPIALLEAMSYNLDVLVSNIPPNLEIGLEEDDYFEVGNADLLAEKIKSKLEKPRIRDFSKKLNDNYNWDSIADSTYEFYKKTIDK